MKSLWIVQTMVTRSSFIILDFSWCIVSRLAKTMSRCEIFVAHAFPTLCIWCVWVINESSFLAFILGAYPMHICSHLGCKSRQCDGSSFSLHINYRCTMHLVSSWQAYTYILRTKKDEKSMVTIKVQMGNMLGGYNDTQIGVIKLCHNMCKVNTGAFGRLSLIVTHPQTRHQNSNWSSKPNMPATE